MPNRNEWLAFKCAQYIVQWPSLKHAEIQDMNAMYTQNEWNLSNNNNGC